MNLSEREVLSLNLSSPYIDLLQVGSLYNSHTSSPKDIRMIGRIKV